MTSTEIGHLIWRNAQHGAARIPRSSRPLAQIAQCSTSLCIFSHGTGPQTLTRAAFTTPVAA